MPKMLTSLIPRLIDHGEDNGQRNPERVPGWKSFAEIAETAQETMRASVPVESCKAPANSCAAPLSYPAGE